ncbi:MAG: cysteine desulfurase-like protein [Actinobacteria bacterium]|nr:cysteine desulfurase-like protein [Actinomycetota bacterium]
MTGAFDVHAARRQFASLDGRLAFFDAPGGTQVPDAVRAAVDETMRDAAANLGGSFATSVRVADVVARARAAGGRFLGCSPDEVVFGANMTSLNFALSRAVGRTLRAGDEVIVTRLDHDANVAPWRELAHDVGIVVRQVDIDPSDCTVDLADLEAQLGERTRIVAFPWACNAVGTVTDAARICRMAHDAGALAWVDATHYAAHEPIDVAAVGADVLLCSPYKVCGPHLGLAFGRGDLLAGWRPYKVAPASDTPVGHRFETGTQPYEQLAGFVASVDYLESIGGLEATLEHTRALGEQFLAGLPAGVRVIGRRTMDGRVPTFLLTADGWAAGALADELVARDFCVGAHDTFYCLGLHERVPYGEAVRVGIFHYHTAAEVDALLATVKALVQRPAELVD